MTTSSIKSSLVNGKDQVHQASADISKEFKSFLHDIEGLFKETASLTGDDLARAKVKLNQRIEEAKETAGVASKTIVQQARRTAEVTNTYVHERPWAVLGAGVAVSFLVGYLLSRRD